MINTRISRKTLLKEIAFYQVLAFVLSLLASRGGHLLRNFGIFALFTNCVAFSIRLPFTIAVRRWGFVGWSRSRQILFSIPTVISGAALGTAVAASLLWVFTQGRLAIDFDYYIRTAGGSLVVASLVTVLVLGFYLLRGALESQALESERLRRLQARTEAMALKSKLNPHFLFNTLDTMIGLVHAEPAKVEEMILTLSNIYRKMLSFPESEEVSLAEEFELVTQYLSLEKARLGDRLRYQVELPEEIRGKHIPPLLIQPLVENAVIHGISRKPGGGMVKVFARKLPGKVMVTVEDDGTGVRQDGAIGFGLYSVREQLLHLYGNQGRMEIRPREGGGTIATLAWPPGEGGKHRMSGSSPLSYSSWTRQQVILEETEDRSTK